MALRRDARCEALHRAHVRAQRVAPGPDRGALPLAGALPRAACAIPATLGRVVSARDLDGDELAGLDATAQADLVASGVRTPEDLVRAACRRIERVDGALGSVAVPRFEEALACAAHVAKDAAFAGVPFLMKDLGARQEGQPYYAGNRALRDADHRAARDTPLGARFRNIGLVAVGNSSTPEFGLQSSTWPLAYGPTRNPWDPTRSPGGSSGGACAAVAAGLVPVAHASDGAGSIRIPAAWCGLVGLKPSRDRVVWRHAGAGRSDIEFVVARSLRDTAAFLQALRRRGRGIRRGGFVAALARPAPWLRVGLCVDSPGGGAVHPDCAEAARGAALALALRGHEVEQTAPDTFAEYLDRALHGAALGMLEYRACLDELAERLGREVEALDVEPFLWELATAEVPSVEPADLQLSIAWNHTWIERTLEWFDDFDLLVTPTVCEPAPPLAALDPRRHSPLELLEVMVPHMAFTEPWNATGQPAMSLPLAWTQGGLPIGVQIVAGPGQDELLLQVAVALMEDAAGPPRLPKVHA
jgi:amidase